VTSPTNEFINLILENSKDFGFSEAEVLYSASKSTEIHVLKGEISQYEASSLQGLSFRGVYDGRMGYAYTEVLEDTALTFLLEQARQNAGAIEAEEKETMYQGDASYREVKSYEKTLDTLSFDDMAKITLTLEKDILSAHDAVEAVDHCISSYGSASQKIKNTLGLDLFQESNMFSIYADVRCKKGNQVKTASGYWLGRDMNALDSKKLSEEIVHKAVSKLDASSVPSGKYTLLLGDEAACDILDTFSGIFSAEAIQKGFSLLKGKIGESIASDIVTIRDDAFVKGSVTETAFDSEGVGTKNLVLVEEGILKGILHNRKTAQKDKTASTGNGFRSYKGSLSVGSKNFYIVPGKLSHEELLSHLCDGIYITDVSGLHAGTNTVSGDFSLLCDGFLVENGKVKRAVEQITIAGNFFTLLKRITHIGKDIFFSSPGIAGATGSPELLISDIDVSGN